MSEWILLKAENYLRPRQESIGGVRTAVGASPYDLPLAARGSYDQQQGSFTIEFRYLTDEATERVPAGDRLILDVGRESGRVLGVMVKTLPTSDPREVKDLIADAFLQAVQHLAKERPRLPNRPENYRVAAQVIRQCLSRSWLEAQPAPA